MHYVPAYLRSLSHMNNGLESMVHDRAEEVESIVSTAANIRFKQSEEIPVWRYEEALQGKTLIEHGRKVKVSEEVDYTNRHWWIITNGLLENLDPPLRDHADIFDLLLSINLRIDEAVAFSQSPGQTIAGAYRVQQGALDFRNDLSPGSLPMALLTMNEIPNEIEVSDSVGDVYEMVRRFRSVSIGSDEDMDIRIGLHMYDDALRSSFWTAASNLFFVCENVLCSGRSSRPVSRIVEVTDMEEHQASNWKKMVNRLKHPDKGDVEGLMQNSDFEVPNFRYMRETTNAALIHAMRKRFNEIGNDTV